jgi:hypothetical protein
MERWLRVSLVLQFILAAYFQLILWFRLGAWNDQPGKRLIELAREGQAALAFGFAILMVLPLLLFILAFWKRWTWLIWLGAVGYGVWALLQIQSWWIPWFFGADQRAFDNAKALERTFKIFPVSPGHPAPDAMHFVLDLLLFAVLGILVIGLFQTPRETVMTSEQTSALTGRPGS